MALFPDLAPNYGYTWTPQFRTDRLGPTDGDFTQRRRRRSTPLYKAVLQYQNIDDADERELLEFFEARSGGHGTFAFFDFKSRVYPLRTLGTADGIVDTWTLHCRDVTDETIYFDTVEQSASIYTISSRTGANGEAQVVFNTPPANTLVITAQYSGKLYLPICIFKEDELISLLAGFQRNRIATVTVFQVNG